MQIYDKYSYNAIIFQPTTKCAWNCQGCYVKKYEKQNNTKDIDPPEWMAEVISKVLDRKDIRANQIIISLNHSNEKSHGPFYSFLIQLISSMSKRAKHDTEIHFTVADMTIDVLREWEIWVPLNVVADVISISIDEFKAELNNIARPRLAGCKAKWNCNLQMTPKVVKQLNDPITVFKSLTEYYDTVYMIAHKPILGDKYNKLHIESIRNTIEIYNKLPAELRKKVFIDKCVETCAKNKHWCEAGTNMMTVWPDGNVIGCPYATHGGNKPSNSLYAMDVSDKPKSSMANQVIRGMLAVRRYVERDYGDRHYFNRCKMRKLWKNIQR